MWLSAKSVFPPLSVIRLSYPYASLSHPERWSGPHLCSDAPKTILRITHHFFPMISRAIANAALPLEQIRRLWLGFKHVSRVLCLCPHCLPKAPAAGGIASHPDGRRRRAQRTGRSFPDVGTQYLQGTNSHQIQERRVEGFGKTLGPNAVGKWAMPGFPDPCFWESGGGELPAPIFCLSSREERKWHCFASSLHLTWTDLNKHVLT